MKEASNDCGGFQPPKGKIDTQMYPECKGTETDRDVVKKNRKKKKEKKAMKVEAKFGGCFDEGTPGKQRWQAWKSQGFFSGGKIPTEEQAVEFVKLVQTLYRLGGAQFIPDDPKYDFLRNRIERGLQALNGGQANVIETAKLFQTAMHEIEQIEVVNEEAFEVNLQESFGSASKEKRLSSKLDGLMTEAKKKKEKYPKEETEPYNPWAVCTDSVGRDDKEKYERCVKKVKDQNKERNEKEAGLEEKLCASLDSKMQKSAKGEEDKAD